MKRNLYSTILLLAITAFAGTNLFAAGGKAFKAVPWSQPGMQTQTAQWLQLAQTYSAYGLYSLNAADVKQHVKESGAVSAFRLTIGQNDWQLVLEPNELRSADYKLLVATEQGIVEYPRSETFTYKGYVEGDNSSIVRLAITNSGISGFISSGGEKMFIEPLRLHVKDAAENVLVVYNAKDVIPVNALCEAIGETPAPQTEAGGNGANTDAVCSLTDISIAADYSMVALLGSVTATEAQLITVMNAVETMYIDSVEIKYRIEKIFISSCPTCDPATWTTTTNNTTLLSNFRTWGNANGFGTTTHDVASFWTDRDICGSDCSVVGTANLSAICTTSKYNILEYFTNSLSSLAIMKAHELGHNWSCAHDAAGAPYIMAPSVGTSTTWSQTSKNSIASHKSTRTCLSSCNIGPAAQFNANVFVGCEGLSVTYTDNSYNGIPTSWSWSFPGGTPSTGNTKSVTVQYNTAGTYDASLTVSNAYGSDSKTKTSLITVEPLVATSVPPYSEGFETMPSFPTGNWQVVNDAGNTWEKTGTAAATGSSCVRVENFSNTNPSGTKDVFITPSFDMTSVPANGVVLFKLAFANKTSSTTDNKLNVYASTNCGQTWGIRYTKTGTSLATAPVTTSNFVPTSTQWRQETVTLSSIYLGKPNVKFKFEYTNNSGNNIYIDDIYIGGPVGITKLTASARDFNIYPNPTDASSMLSFELGKNEKVSIVVADILGRDVKEVFSGTLNAGEHQFSTGDIGPAGIYIIKASFDNQMIIEKLIVR